MKSVCDNCMHSWRHGLSGNKQHIWCTANGGRVVKNKLKGCPYYSEATPEQLNNLRRRKIQGKGFKK